MKSYEDVLFIFFLARGLLVFMQSSYASYLQGERAQTRRLEHSLIWIPSGAMVLLLYSSLAIIDSANL